MYFKNFVYFLSTDDTVGIQHLDFYTYDIVTRSVLRPRDKVTEPSCHICKTVTIPVGDHDKTVVVLRKISRPRFLCDLEMLNVLFTSRIFYTEFRLYVSLHVYVYYTFTLKRTKADFFCANLPISLESLNLLELGLKATEMFGNVRKCSAETETKGA